MREVGAYEAKTALGKLLDAVEKGERIAITRHGHPVALLVPVRAPGRSQLSDTLGQLREFRKGRRLGESLRGAIERGRR